MAGQEATFHDHVEASFDLFPEIEVLSDNSVFDLVLICGLVLVPAARWHVIISPVSFPLFQSVIC